MFYGQEGAFQNVCVVCMIVCVCVRRLNTDILFGNECGMWTVQVLTGVSSLQEARGLSLTQDPQIQKQIPLFYLQSISDMLSLLSAAAVNNEVDQQQQQR